MTRRAALLAGAAIAAPFVASAAASAAAITWMGLWDHFSVPFAQWFSYWPLRHEDKRIADAVHLGAGAGIMALLAGYSALRPVVFPKDALHGRAGWLRDREAKKGGLSFSRRPRGDTILLGRRGWGPFRRYVALPGEEHASLTAKTRSGKGVSVVVPNALNTACGLLCFSVKRDVFRDTAGERAKKGDAVFVFDLSDPQRRTHRWNPLGYVRRGEVETYGDIQRAMWFLVPETKSNNPFWDNAARKLGTAVGVLLAETPGHPLTVAAVLGTVQRPDWGAHLLGMIDGAKRAGRPYPLAPANVARRFAARAGQKEAEEVIETLTTALALWNDPVVAAATEASDFDLSALRSERMSVFVCGGPADIRIYRPVYGLLFQQLVQLNTRLEFGEDPSHRHRVLGILDEFWALGKQDVLADASAFTASYGFRWLYVQQSQEQSVSAFGKEGAKNLFTNTGARLAFGGMDMDEAEEISKWAGDNTVAEVSRSRPRFNRFALDRQSESERAQRRRLVLAQEVRRLDAKELLVRRGNLDLLRLDRIVWFRDRRFKRMAAAAPEIPPLRVAVERDA